MRTLLTNLPAGQVPERYSETGYMMLVADGMGGAPAGEVASRTAVSTLFDLVVETPDWIMRLDEQRVGEVLRRMEGRFDRLTEALTQLARSDTHLSGMGTTMTLAVSLGADLVIVHVGDSRAYLFRRGHLVRLTDDQTVAQLLVAAGAISPEVAAKHYARRVLTSAITAGGEKAEVALHHLRLMDDDQLLLCSDGLTEMVSEARIAKDLGKRWTAANACRVLVHRALEAGGGDNVTALLAHYHIPEDGARRFTEQPGARVA